MKRRAILSILGSVSLLTLGIGQTHGQTFLSEDEILSRIVGHKLGGISAEGAAWEETYHAPKKAGQRKGKITGREAGSNYSGQWQVRDGDAGGVFCVSSPGYYWCGHIEWLEGGRVNWYEKNGTLTSGYPDTRILE